MQFLLVAVNAKFIHTNPAIYSLRAYAGETLRSYISLAEYTINNRQEEILADIYKRKPEAIGFSCYIWNWKLIRELLAELPKVLPDTEIWLGGPEVSFESQKILDTCPMVKGIMVGEGEETFRELLFRYVKRENKKEMDFENIPGLILRESGLKSRDLLDMDQLPFLYPDLEQLKNKIVYYESSRGCPFRCSYCLSSIDKRMRLRSMDKVKKELQIFLDHQVPQVKFIDRTFNGSKKHAMEIWRYIKENDNGVTNFHFEIAADLMDEEELEMLQDMRPGLVQLEIGVQTTNEAVLREVNRPTDLFHIQKVVERIRDGRNIHIHLDLIAGLPLEGMKSFQHSFDQVYAMKPEQLQLGFLKVLKGTPIWERAEEYGIAYGEQPPYEVLYTKWISYGEILKLKQVEEMVELYYNSNQFRHMLPVLEKEFASPYDMYQAIADYYEEKGYFVNTPARSHRYQVLLDFAIACAPQKQALYRELLIYDYYLRENAKSRPDFGTDQTAYHSRVWEFYQREEQTPGFLSDYKGRHARELMKMTHMEAFWYPVWEKEAELVMVSCDAPRFLLFDYEKRDPLTMEAATFLVL